MILTVFAQLTYVNVLHYHIVPILYALLSSQKVLSTDLNKLNNNNKLLKINEINY